MKHRQSNVQIWFLDRDLAKSAEYLTDHALEKTLDGCFAALSCAALHFSGVRSKKAHAFLFSRERRADTMARLFPGWPFVKPPQLRYYTSRASRWARACRENFDYAKSYFDALLQEYEYRRGRRHRLAGFSDWVDSDMPAVIPAAGIAEVALPWKNLSLKYRRRDVIEGYRLQYAHVFLWGDPLEAYASSPREVPEFVVRMFGLEGSSMVT